VLGRKGPAKKEGGACAGKEGRPFFHSVCVCVCVLSYKLPTPLPLLLQCRGGRRLSQVVFTQLKRQITNRIISFSSQSTINNQLLSFSVVLGLKKKEKFGGREEIREFFVASVKSNFGDPFHTAKSFSPANMFSLLIGF
jgi:hypothetical protein